MHDESSLTQLFRLLVGRLPGRILRCALGSLALSVVVALAQLSVVGFVSLLGAAVAAPQSVAGDSRLAWLREMAPGKIWDDPGLFLTALAVCCLVAVLSSNVLRVVNEYLVVKSMRETERYYSNRMLSGLIHMPYQWHMNNNSSDLVMAVYWSSHYGAMTRGVLALACDFFSAAIILAGVFIISPMVALGTLGTLGIVALIIYHLMKARLDYYSTQFRDVTLSRVRTFNLGIQGVKDVKIFGREEGVLRQADTQMKKAVEVGAKQELVRVLPTYFLETVGFALVLGVIILLTNQDVSYARVAGTVTLFAAAGWKILPSVGKMLSSVTGLRASWPYILKSEKYYREIADNKDVCAGTGAADVPGGIHDRLELDDIDFSYPGAESKGLDGVDLTIRKGQAIGVIGPSGAGKTTLVNILSGLLAVGSGAVKVDGKKMSREAFRVWQVNSIGYVPQSPYICDGTIEENVAFGLQGDVIDRDRVLECCRMAAIDFLDSLPQGVDTPIGERGVRLSGGQQQRIAIARALYKQPEIIIFDEATSALDTRNERTIQETIYSLKGAVTLVIVAHRLSTVAGCDEVYWIDAGRVRMSGTADEVLRRYGESQVEKSDAE